MAEPDITGGGGQQMSFPGMSGGNKPTGTAARIGARITSDGVEKLEGKFKSLLNTLRSVRTELLAINNGGAPVNGGIASNPNASRLGDMIKGFQETGVGGAGRANGGLASGAISIGFMSMGSINSRMTRNMVESAGISSRDALNASMYGFDYKTAEANRFTFSGSFGGSRVDQQAAFQTGLSYGQLPEQNLNFMRSLGNVVQASGGTMNIAQAAASAAGFQDPVVMRRAIAMGMTPGRVAGQAQNPLQSAQEFMENYQQRRGVRFNEADFANMASASSGIRIDMQRLYGLDNNSIDMARQAGMQNLTFQRETGSRRNIDFENPDDLRAIGMDEDVLGLRSQQLSTAVGRRDARFFAKQEGAMNRRIGQEITIQDTLADVEDKFSGLIGTLYQFENALKAITGALGAASMLGLGGMLAGRGGGGIGAMGGIGGVPIGATPRVGTVGSTMTGGPSMPIGGPAGGMGMAAKLGIGAMGAGMMFGGMQMAGQGGLGNTIMGGIGGAAGGAMMAPLLGMSGPVGAAVGVTAVGAADLYGSMKSNDGASVSYGQDDAAGMSDSELIASLTSYGANPLIQAKGAHASGGIFDTGAGPKERGRFDVWAARRSQLTAAFIDAVKDAGGWGDLTTAEAGELGKLYDFFTSSSTNDDSAFNDNAEKSLKYIAEARSSYPDLYNQYFGSAEHPFADTPINTAEYRSLIMSNRQVLGAYIPGGQTGDPVTGGDGNPWTMVGGAADGRTAGHPTWDRLDPRMKERLSAMFAASGGRVWLGEGWRDPVSSEPEFFRRHYEDPNGSREYKGKRYSLRDGMAPMAPPGRSNHNIGLAADLVGDMDWLQQNAARFGLKTFANVPNINEPWHVQLAELANGFLGNGEDQGTGNQDSNQGSNALIPEGAPGGLMALGGGGGYTTITSGVGFSIASALGGGGGGSRGGFRGTAASTTAGMLGEVPEYTGGKLTAEQVAVMAYQAGFRGQDLVNVVAIAKRESDYNPGVLNPDSSTGDYSFGLMQINMIGELGPARREQFGISRNEDLYDPQTNLNAAFMMYQARGNSLYDWGPYKGKPATYSTDVAAAAQAVINAGIQGDPVPRPQRFDAPAAQGSGVVINMGGITIQSSGSPAYDADAFIRAVRPKLEEVAGMTVKRAGG